MALWQWSQTPNLNQNSDLQAPWPEGMAPSQVNDSARGMMAVTAKYRDDISGLILTAGTSTAYTISSNSGYATLAHLAGQLIAFTPHTSNGATVTLNVDSLGAKPLRPSPGVEFQSNTLIQGTPYFALYNATDGAFYLHCVGSSPGVPLGASLDYWLATTPGSAWAFAAGQAISRATYSTLFAQMGTIYGTGDGSTTFNLPDTRGRVVAAADSMGGSAAGRLTTIGSNLGNAGGSQNQSLVVGQIPDIASSGSASVTVSAPNGNNFVTAPNGGIQQLNNVAGAGVVNATFTAGTAGALVANTGAVLANGPANVSSNNTGGADHNNVQPTMMTNYVLFAGA
jgi:microcystin-dependent protein